MLIEEYLSVSVLSYAHFEEKNLTDFTKNLKDRLKVIMSFQRSTYHQFVSRAEPIYQEWDLWYSGD